MGVVADMTFVVALVVAFDDSVGWMSMQDNLPVLEGALVDRNTDGVDSASYLDVMTQDIGTAMVVPGDSYSEGDPAILWLR